MNGVDTMKILAVAMTVAFAVHGICLPSYGLESKSDALAGSHIRLVSPLHRYQSEDGEIVAALIDDEATEVSRDPALQIRYKTGPNLTFQSDLAYASDGSLFTVFHTERGWEVRAGERTLARYAISKHNLQRFNMGGYIAILQ